MQKLELLLMPETLAVCRFAPDTPFPDLASVGGFVSLTRTADELSLVVPEEVIQADWQAETGWRGFKVLGPLDFSMLGVLAELSTCLAQAGVSIFAISTYDTDYLLVKADALEAAVAALREADFGVVDGEDER